MENTYSVSCKSENEEMEIDNVCVNNDSNDSNTDIANPLNRETIKDIKEEDGDTCETSLCDESGQSTIIQHDPGITDGSLKTEPNGPDAAAEFNGMKIEINDVEESNTNALAEITETKSDTYRPVNSVDELLKRPFLTRTLEEQLIIKQLGRPTPDLDLTNYSVGVNRTYKRSFNRGMYDRNNWVCGCDIRNALFCFPCLLFGNSDPWAKCGRKDLGHLSISTKKHRESKKHINNVLDLSAVGGVNIETLLTRAYLEEKVKHNQQVERNRYVLSRIIDCIKFCGAFELALRVHDETSEDPNVLFGLVDLLSSIDSAVKEHIESYQAFRGKSKSIQNDLLYCMLETCREVIMEEMKQAEFIAIMAEETTHVSEQPQLVLLFRYEKNGVPHERFWGFFKPVGLTADAIARCILNELDEMFKDTSHKIIAQTWDGVHAISGGKTGVQEKIKIHYPNAHYIHCYAHHLTSTMEKAASQNQSARLFFLNLSGFPSFFSRSPECLLVLEAVAVQRNPRRKTRRWNFKSKTVNVVDAYKKTLAQCLSKLEKSSSNRICLEAYRLRCSLKDDDFLFWLSFFRRLMQHVDTLHDQLQATSIDAMKVKDSVSQFVLEINEIRDSVDNMNTAAGQPLENKRQKLSNRPDDAKQVCDSITQEISDRFKSLDHLEAEKLLTSSNFEKYSINFPCAELNTTTQTYSMLESNKLKAELSVFYQRQDFWFMEGIVPFLQFILTNSLQETFSEVTKLLKILITTPMRTSEPERCFSSLKRIKTFLQNTVTPMSQEQLSALAMLSIQKEMISSIEGFNARVIEKFCTRKQCRMDFTFRQ